MAVRTVLALALGLLLAGCLDDDAGGAPPPAPEQPLPGPDPGPAEDCDLDAGLPTLPTWAAHGGQWSSFVQADLAHPQGQRGAGSAGEPGLGLLVDHAGGSFAAIDVEVQVRLVAGEHPDGAGLVFHWAGGSYNIVRYSPSEDGWHVFTVIDGQRTKLDDVQLDPAAPAGPEWCQWTALRVVADGADVTVFQDGQRVLTARLPAGASMSGEAGLFVRGATVAHFSGYSSSAA